MTEQPTLVFLAGIGNSGPEHWQRRWYEREARRSVWVEHDSWDGPVRDAWVDDLADTLASVPGPKVLVAHSLGCTLLAEWAHALGDAAGGVAGGLAGEVAGAFLVAVPDVAGESFPAEAEGFDGAAYRRRLPFPATVVASEDDPYGSLEHATATAERLGARLVNVGRSGHINASSGLGDWDEGWALLHDGLGDGPGNGLAAG
ncbi:alpha/beta hydrolase [Kitasatospora sp. NPDC093806]|uniref:RBBP9/YdeN family alpha/beta hydrolase n=1 Tax=Kitasatospora sp. NPDC093806 TaxID=3155075 RepID=UPI00341A9FFF